MDLEAADQTQPPHEGPTAFHEAGHAVVALCFGWPVATMTIGRVKGESAGKIHLVDGDAPAASDPVGVIAFLAAGICAEMLARGDPLSYLADEFWKAGEDDRREADRIATDELGCENGRPRYLKAIAACVFQFIERRATRKAVTALATMLLEKQKLAQEEIEAIWRTTSVPQTDVDRFKEELDDLSKKTRV